MLNETIEFKNPVYGLVKKAKSKAIKKIKFKPLSFDRISSKWKKFLAERLDKKLEKSKEKLVSTEVSQNGFEPGLGGISSGEKKILRRAQSVAKLEAKINFLRTGQRVSKDIVNSRAIKLKSNMMENMRFNRDYVYSVLPEDADKIFEVKPVSPVNNANPVSNNQSSTDEVQKKVADSVKQMMTENEQNKKTPPTGQTEATKPDRQSIKDAVDQIFKNHEAAQTKVNNTNNNIKNTSTGTINKNDIMNEINNAANKVKVSTNKSKAAKINPFIKEDGTYHIKGTDIDDELRYTHVDLKNYNYTPKFNTQQVGEGEISPINSFKASFEDLPIPKKVEINNQNTGLNDDVFGKKEVTSNIPTTLTSDKREVPLVAPERKQSQVVDKFKLVDATDEKQVESSKPVETSNIEGVKKESGNLHFDYSNASVKDLTSAVDRVTNMDEISALFQRVQTLKQEQERTRKVAENAARCAEASRNTYEETVNKFRAYGNSLEAACNENMQKAEESRNIQRANEEKIQMMTEAMGSMAEEMVTLSSGKGK